MIKSRPHRRTKPIHQRFGLFLHPVFQALFWIITFLLAAFASLYADAIKELSAINPIPENLGFFAGAWEWIKARVTALSVYFYVFSLSALILALSFGFTAWIKTKREEYLFQIMQTNPPQGFWDRFEDATAKNIELHEAVQLYWAYELTDPLKQKARLDASHKAVRSMLDNLINLVKCWDVGNIERNIVYRANIMEVIYFDEKSSSDLPEVKSEMQFYHGPIDSHYSGAVILKDNTFTTSTDTPESDPDEGREALILAFSFNDNANKDQFFTNLRGAPYAVVTKEADYVNSVTSITEHYIENAEPQSKQIVNNLEQYYSLKDSPAQSILSIPLFRTESPKVGAELIASVGETGIDEPTESSQKAVEPDSSSGNTNVDLDTTRVRWVINIYRNQPGMLYNKEKNRQFVQIASGLTARIHDAMDIMHSR